MQAVMAFQGGEEGMADERIITSRHPVPGRGRDIVQ
jgi:hypothetical protein